MLLFSLFGQCVNCLCGCNGIIEGEADRVNTPDAPARPALEQRLGGPEVTPPGWHLGRTQRKPRDRGQGAQLLFPPPAGRGRG